MLHNEIMRKRESWVRLGIVMWRKEKKGKEMNEKRRAGQGRVIDESEGVNKRPTVWTNESPSNNEVLQRSAKTATHTNIPYQLLVVLLSPNTHTHTHTHAYTHLS